MQDNSRKENLRKLLLGGYNKGKAHIIDNFKIGREKLGTDKRLESNKSTGDENSFPFH